MKIRMDIVIAAAGKGTRLQDLTKELPKHILPIAGRPFLYYLLDAAVEARFRRIIVVGEYHFEKLQEAVAAYPAEDTEIVVVNQADYVPSGRYGTSCPLFAVEDLVQGDRFVYTMGDHLLSVEDLVRMQQSSHEILIAGFEHSEPERYGVLEEDETHHLTRIIEKPTNPKSNRINVGLYAFNRSVFPLVHSLPASPRGEYEITDVINSLAKRDAVSVVPLTGYWIDLGRPEDIASLEEFINASK